MNRIPYPSRSLPAAVLLVVGLFLQSCQSQLVISTPTAPLILPTVFPTGSPTPVLTATPRPTITPTKTVTATQEPDFASTPWAQYECQDRGRIIFRVGLRGRVVIDRIELLEQPAAPDSPSYKLVRLLQAREHIRVLNGPQCKDGQTWWEVTTESSNTGWIPEIDSIGRRLLTR